RVVEDAGIEVPPSPTASPSRAGDVEVVRRGELTFVINHGADAAELRIDGTDVLTGAAASGLELPSQGVAIVRS
ncbi:MAG: beta-galactosidase, partial [Agromyces sp.]|nr:beta-galactosidase [Agromyces sp.]